MLGNADERRSSMEGALIYSLLPEKGEVWYIIDTTRHLGGFRVPAATNTQIATANMQEGNS